MIIYFRKTKENYVYNVTIYIENKIALFNVSGKTSSNLFSFAILWYVYFENMAIILCRFSF